MKVILLTGFIFCATLASQGLAQTAKRASVDDFDVRTFLETSVKRVKQLNFVMMSDYTYKFRRSSIDQKGKQTSRLFELYFPSRIKKRGGSRGVSVQLEENGVPFTPAKIEKLRAEAAKELEKQVAAPDKDSSLLEAERERGLDLTWKYEVGVNMTSVLVRCKFAAPSPGKRDGREAIVLDLRDCGSVNSDDSLAYVSSLRGQVWFDTSDKVPGRLDAWSSSAQAGGAVPKPIVHFKQKRVADGLWLPEVVIVEGIGNESIFPKLKLNWRMEFFDYKLSETEVKAAKVNDPTTSKHP